MVDKNSKEMQQATLDDAMNMLRDMLRRVRQLEERYANMRKTVQVNEQNVIASRKKTNVDLKAMDLEIAEVKKHMRNMGEEIKLLVKEAKDSVRKEDVKLLEKYINFWQPLNYVTHNELEKEVKKQVKKQLAQRQHNKIT